MEFSELAGYVIDGNAEGTEKFTREALSQGIDPLQIVNQGLVPGMDVVGERFRKQECFIPHVLLSAKAMKAAMIIVRPLIARRSGESARRVVIGTVKGDLHDIGKSLVGMALEGAGYEVTDLGADVAPEAFITAVKEQDARMLCMSALLTTTRPMMKATIDYLRDSAIGHEVKVMVGGVPVTPDYATEIGADGYAPDAFTAVDRARELLSPMPG